MWETTVSEEKNKNIHVPPGTSEEDFVKLRKERDQQLPMPNLFIPSVQVNIRAGQHPKPEGNGRIYLKIPLNTL